MFEGAVFIAMLLLGDIRGADRRRYVGMIGHLRRRVFHELWGRDCQVL
jgi:hypothetical protein